MKTNCLYSQIFSIDRRFVYRPGAKKKKKAPEVGSGKVAKKPSIKKASQRKVADNTVRASKRQTALLWAKAKRRRLDKVQKDAKELLRTDRELEGLLDNKKYLKKFAKDLKIEDYKEKVGYKDWNSDFAQGHMNYDGDDPNMFAAYVAALQMRIGLRGDAVDGMFGPATRKALMHYLEIDPENNDENDSGKEGREVLPYSDQINNLKPKFTKAYIAAIKADKKEQELSDEYDKTDSDSDLKAANSAAIDRRSKYKAAGLIRRKLAKIARKMDASPDNTSKEDAVNKWLDEKEAELNKEHGNKPIVESKAPSKKAETNKALSSAEKFAKKLYAAKKKIKKEEDNVKRLSKAQLVAHDKWIKDGSKSEELFSKFNDANDKRIDAEKARDEAKVDFKTLNRQYKKKPFFEQTKVSWHLPRDY